MFFGIVAAIIAASGKKVPTIQSGSYLVFDLQTNITDAPPRVDLGDLSERQSETLQLHSLTRALHAASDDSRIKGILIVGSLSPSGYGSGYGALAEVRAPL